MFHNLGLKPVDNFYIMAIVFLCVYIAWFLVFSEEASAPPIVVNTTKTREENKNYLLTSSNVDGQGIKNTNGLVTDDFSKTNMPGKSGLAYAGLGQPCLTEGSNTVNPNLPQGYAPQPCDTHKGLQCVTGIYQGGGICLKSVNQSCDIKTDCAPEAEFCLNNICQTRDEVINRSCKSHIECRGPLGDLNHVCDFKTNKCVYDIWPKDSGCTDKTQCNYYSQFPNSVECRTAIGGSAAAILILEGTYTGNSITISSSSLTQFNQIKSDINQTYVSVREKVTGSYQGRLRISSISGNKVTLIVPSIPVRSFPGKQNIVYDLEFGTQKDGICLVKFPDGTPPTTVKGTTNITNKCSSGSNTVNGYCVEAGRTNKKGSLEQVCTSNEKLTCDDDLTCTYDNDLVSNFNSLIDSYHVDSGLSVNGQIIKDIGKCKKQTSKIYESCFDDCIKPLVCLNEMDINSSVFRYCGYEWDIMNDVSDLTNCPLDGQQNRNKGPIFAFSNKFDTQCKAARGTFCFSDSDCVGSGKCGSGNNYSFSSYNPLTNSYSFYPGSFTHDTDLYFLVSKEDNNGRPKFITYYYKSSNTSWIFYKSTDGGRTFSSNTNTITFEESPVKDPTFSLTYLGGNNYQLNVEYITEYQDSTKRKFDNISTYNFYNSALREGTSVYFEDSTINNEVYNISYDTGYINAKSNPLNILKLKKSDGTSIGVSAFTGDLVTYSSVISANVESTGVANRYLPIENDENSFNSGDSFTYIEGDDANNVIEYLNNTGGGATTELTNEENYFSIIFDRSPLNTGSQRKEIYFTEKYNTINSNPVLGNQKMNQFGIRVKADPQFSEANSRIQLKSVYGYRFLPINITNNPPQTITIERETTNYVSTQKNTTDFNRPIGYFSDTTDITAEITEDNILLTYKNNGSNVQVLSLSYRFTETSNNDIFNLIETSNGSCYIYYNINNSLKIPSLKVTAESGYTTTDTPYSVDEVRYFENDSQTAKNNDTISFLTTYKDIQPSTPRTSVGNITNMRKLNLETTLTNPTSFNPKYQGLDNINPPSTLFYGTLPFGSTGYSQISQIKEAINVTDTSGNLFLGGTQSIFFKNPKDIDLILKYGSSELVISYNSRKNAVAIVGILEYNVDDKGNETLEVQTSFIINHSDNLGKDTAPVIYFNNIYPITCSISANILTLNDGRILVSSSRNPDEDSDKFKTSKTNYNKVLYQMRGGSGSAPSSTYSFFDYYQIENGFDGLGKNIFNNGTMDTSKPVFLNKESNTDIYNKFNSSSPDYELELINNVETTLPSIGTTVYIINNQYLSSTALSSSPIFLNNTTYFNNFSVLAKYQDGTNTPSRTFGGIYSKINTFPFYTGLSGDEGMLDETYLKEIKWPYWIKNLNTGTIVINKVFLTYDPGNMENNMFYYCLATVSGVNMLLYFSTNFSRNDIKESHSVPIVVSNFNQMRTNMKMLPYNKNLLLFSKYCSSN